MSEPSAASRQLTTIEVSKEYLHFSSAHFTIFSATEREDLHGHTFYVTAEVSAWVGDDGLAFDYNLLKNAIKALCDRLDEKVLLPERSPFLKLSTAPLFEGTDYVIAEFNGERLPFLPRDVLLLPIRNVAVEELAPWVLKTLVEDPAIVALALESMKLRVSSGAGQWAAAHWDKDA